MHPACNLPATGLLRLAATISLLTLHLLSSANAYGQSTPTKPSIIWYGDHRLRAEQDWDSQTAAGAARDDRVRARFRLRFGANITFDENWTSGIRARTGNSDSQQSPHLTFSSDPGSSDKLDGILDKYFLRYANGSNSFWIGRNIFPFWQQNEFFWDDDVTPTGLVTNFANLDGRNKLSATFGAFALPDGGWGLNGSLLSGQFKYTDKNSSGDSQITLALGMHRFNGKNGAKELLSNNGARDYLLANLGAQWVGKLRETRLALGLDVFKNLESYTAAELAPFSTQHANEDLGYVLSAQLGQLKEQGDWLYGYYYAHIETLAVNASYAQDDWVRFGTATQTAGSDCKGHELRLGYAFSPTLNLVSRLFVVDSITSNQDGKRFRIDLNWKY